MPYIVDSVLVPALPKLLARMKLRIELVADNRNLSLSRREADFAIRFVSGSEAGPDGRLSAVQQLGAVGYAVYGPRSANDPERLPWATFDDLYAHLPEARWTLKACGATRPEFKVSRTESLRALVANGLAKAVLPEVMGDRDETLVRLTPEPVLKRNLCLISLSTEHGASYLTVVANWIGGLFERPKATLHDG